MWYGEVEMDALRARKLWKVEFFSEPTVAKMRSAYPLVPLAELVSERGEAIDPMDYPDHTFNYLGLEHVEGLTGDLVGYAPRAGREVLSRSKVFRAGDVLYGRLRPYLNKVFVASGAVENGICSGEFFVLVPNKRLASPRLLRTLLASELVRSAVAQWQIGSTHPRLRLTDLLGVLVPLPPPDEQRRVEAFLARSEAQRRAAANRVRALPLEIEGALLKGLGDGTAGSLELVEAKAPAEERFEHELPAAAFGRRKRQAESASPPDPFLSELVVDYVKSRSRS